MTYLFLINIFRRLNSGSSNAIDAKLQAKSIVLKQWKLIKGLQSYFSKFTSDKTFENILNKEFALFLQKIDARTYGNGLVKYFTPEITANQSVDRKEATSIPNVFSNLVINISNKEEKKVIPKWKIPKSTPSNVSIKIYYFIA